MAIYLGDEKNLARKILKFYIGDENGVARKVTKAYIGDANGVARLFYTAHTHAYLSNDDYTFDDTINTSQHYYTKSCECGDTITEWEDHDYESDYREPDCTHDGWYDVWCPVCGRVDYSRWYDATGHDWVDATCTENGYCANCGATGDRATGHDWVDATCTENGYCANCGATGDRATGHDWVDATCTENGYCANCGATGDFATGHDYQSTGLYETLITGEMWEVYRCTNCGDTYREYVGSSSGGTEDSSQQ